MKRDYGGISTIVSSNIPVFNYAYWHRDLRRHVLGAEAALVADRLAVHAIAVRSRNSAGASGSLCTVIYFLFFLSVDQKNFWQW